MSYQSSINAMSIPAGMPGSAIINPSAAGINAMSSMPELDALIAAGRSAAAAAPGQVAQADATISQLNSTIATQGTPATPEQLQAIQDATALKARAQQTLDSHGDFESMVQDHQSSVGELTTFVDTSTTASLATLSTDMSVLNGAMSGMDHAARVDAAIGGAEAPHSYTDELVCSENSIVRRGLRALTDAGKKLAEMAKSVRDKIKSVIGDIKDWTADAFHAIRDKLSNMFAGVKEMVSGLLAEVKQMFADSAAALKDALNFVKNKAFMGFLSFTNPCMSGALKDLVDPANVDMAAVERARSIA